MPNHFWREIPFPSANAQKVAWRNRGAFTINHAKASKRFARCAGLDVDNEKHINDSLKSLQMTRISVAHRPEISSSADRILQVARTVVRDAPGSTPRAIANQQNEVATLTAAE